MKKDGLGAWGEEIALAYLVSQGYACIAHNWRMGHYEIDIVMQKADQIVFVEVKTRTSADSDPVGAVNQRKRARMTASADVFIKHYNLPFEYRFDIVAITGTRERHSIEHIPDAFMPTLKRINYSFRL